MMLDDLLAQGMHGLLLALTPTERWQAARTPDPGMLTNRWFILVCVVILVALTVLLFWVSLHRLRQEHRVSDQAFIEIAGEKSLTVRECQVLQTIARHADVRKPEAVFANRAEFERGAIQMIEEATQHKDDQEKQRLVTEVALLREKIGFSKAYATLGNTQTRALSSRQIPVAKHVTLTPMLVNKAQEINGIVHGNEDHSFIVQLDEPIKVTFGGLWTIRYSLGASVWEFEASVMSYDGTLLVLSHSDHVRFVNRRRFLRVPVTRRALVAKFPFEQTVEWTDTVVNSKYGHKEILPMHPIDAFGSLELMPATVTELGGPGLRIETSLDVTVGERLLVIFDLEVEPLVSDSPVPVQRRARLVEDIGEVRHIRQLDRGASIAVELSGLKDADVNELIRATNAALIEANEKKRAKDNADQMVLEEVAV